MDTEVLRMSTIAAAGEAPTEFRIFAAGVTETAYGPYLFDEVSAALVMKAYADQGVELMIDYEHKSLDPAAAPGAGKAAGWFTPEVRDGELWAVNVRWTEDAAEGLRKREWRYFSPAALIEKDTGRVVLLINVALTNMPATLRMEPLMASRLRDLGRPEDPLRVVLLSSPTLLALLGLPATASEKDVADELTTLKTAGQRVKEMEKALLSATGADTFDRAIGVALGWKAAADQLVTARERIRQLETEGERRDRDTLLAQYGKKFTPALKEWAKTQSLDALRGFVASAPDIPALASSEERARTSDDATEPGDGAADLPTGGKRWEEMTPRQKHELYFSNRRAYDALKRDYERRTDR